MIINKSGIVIRIVVSELRVMGRATQGVRLINLKGNDEIASVARIEHEEDEVEETESYVVLDGEPAGESEIEDEPADDATEENDEEEGDADEDTTEEEK
ncbi:DNA gyrase subunit A [compost metagenome]